MNPDRIIDPEKIQLLRITTLKGNIESEGDAQGQEAAAHGFDFELKRGLDLQEKLVGLQIVVNIQSLAADRTPLSTRGSYTHELLFQVENLEEFVESGEDGKPILDWLMVSTLTGIAFSTIRGIIYIRTQGTSLGTVILPVIDPKRLLEG